MRRVIEQALIDFIDLKLAGNGLAKQALIAGDARMIMVLAAEALVGIREATGHNDGKMIRLIQETVGGAAGEPYCIGGVMTCLAYAEVKTQKKSALIATELATALWGSTPADMKVKGIPLPGAIAIWQDRDKKTKKKKITGHGEIVRSAANTQWFGVGFNTSGASYPGGPVNRDGNGVYFTNRNYADTPGRVLLGFIKPF